MARDRKINREKIREKEMLNRQNEYGNNDPTPYQAVIHIIKQQPQQKAR